LQLNNAKCRQRWNNHFQQTARWRISQVAEFQLRIRLVSAPAPQICRGYFGQPRDPSAAALVGQRRSWLAIPFNPKTVNGNLTALQAQFCWRRPTAPQFRFNSGGGNTCLGSTNAIV